MPVTWTPEHTDTALWLDAADSSTITHSGGTVSEWADKSGNGWDAIPYAAGYEPSVIPNILNGLSALSFTADMMASANGAINEARLSIFMVASSTQDSSFPFWITHSVAGEWPYYRFNWFHASTTSMQFTIDAEPYSSNVVENFFSSSPAILAQDTYGGSVWRNGVVAESFAGREITYPNSVPYHIGIMTGTVAEIIILDHQVSEQNRQLIEGYLAHKWGLESDLPGGHPYASSAPQRYSISGIITDTESDAVARTVRAYARDTGLLLAETTSDASTGAYELGFVSDDEIQRVVIANETEIYNDIIDRVIPG